MVTYFIVAMRREHPKVFVFDHLVERPRQRRLRHVARAHVEVSRENAVEDGRVERLHDDVACAANTSGVCYCEVMRKTHRRRGS